MRDKASQRWDKYPDAPLSDVIAKKQLRRMHAQIRFKSHY
jgi:hypothetical protein